VRAPKQVNPSLNHAGCVITPSGVVSFLFFIPIDFPFLFAVEELYGTWYQIGSFSLISDVLGVVFNA
jgi:hypothetical protein